MLVYKWINNIIYNLNIIYYKRFLIIYTIYLNKKIE